jgi:hypothetical protein
VVTEDHAKALLRGELLHVESNSSRLWPVFSLYKGGKQRFMELIEEAIKDKEVVQERIEAQKRYEWELLMSNRYELEDDDEEEEGGGGGGAEGGGGGGGDDGSEDSEEAMTPEEEEAENQELAAKFETTAHEVQEFREMFQLVDLDHGGSIDGEELGKLLSLLGMEKSEEEIQEMVDKIDTTGEGEVFFPDFVRALKSDRPAPKYNENMVLEAFKFFSDKIVEGTYTGATIKPSSRHAANKKKTKKEEGIIMKKQLAFGLSNYSAPRGGDEVGHKKAWTEEQTENALHDAGLTRPDIDYLSFVHIMFQLASN